jgi:hypothetical protein
VDPSNGQPGAWVLNCDEVKVSAIERWKAVTHPTIETIMVKFLTYRQQHSDRPWKDFVIWKMDLRGAFTLLSFKSSNAPLIATQLVGGLVLIFLCGIFGWTATPIAFAVISRAVIFELEKRLSGPTDMHVDDVIGMSLEENAVSDRLIARDVQTRLLGDDAVEDDKTEFTTAACHSMVVLGYCIDKERQVVTISRRNFLKTLYVFFNVDLEGLVAVKDLERIASMVSRYGSICPVLRPFARPIYAAYSHLRRGVRIPLKPEAKRAIRLWRAMLCATSLNPAKFARPFHTFLPRRAQAVVVFDASLTGVGIKLLVIDQAQGTEVPVGAGQIGLDSFGCGADSSFQNTCEFVAQLVGLVALVRIAKEMNVEVNAVLLRGDSVSALTWANAQSYRGEAVSNAASLFALLVVRYDIQIVTEHIAGTDNGECDALSREGRVGDVLPGVRDLRLAEDRVMIDVVRLCNPRLQVSQDVDFLGFWHQANAIVRSLSSEPFLTV